MSTLYFIFQGSPNHLTTVDIWLFEKLMPEYKLHEGGREFLSARSTEMGFKRLEQSWARRRRSANVCGRDEKIYPEIIVTMVTFYLWSFYIMFNSINVNENQVSPVTSGTS